jgi:hypothetical protein
MRVDAARGIASQVLVPSCLDNVFVQLQCHWHGSEE